MAHFPSTRLSRNELYSYGFKEGQPWAEDRRALESALQAMDKLELDIKQNYMYGRSSGTNDAYTSPVAASRHTSRSTSGSYYPPARYPTPDLRIARSDNSDRYSEVSSVSPYSGRAYDYRDSPNFYPSPQAARHQPTSSTPIYARSSSGAGIPHDYPNYQQQYYAAPPSHMSPSRSDSRSARTGQAQYSPDPSRYYGSRESGYASARAPADAAAQLYSPSQMQLVSRGGDGHSSQDDYSDDGQSDASLQTSPQWSMDATQGTSMSERVMSDASGSSQEMYSSGYSDVTRSSGYVESYDVASYGTYRDSEDDHDYMSDDIASNEGEYYSSSDELEYEGEGDDIYSDQGSDSYDDGGYDDYSD